MDGQSIAGAALIAVSIACVCISFFGIILLKIRHNSKKEAAAQLTRGLVSGQDERLPHRSPIKVWSPADKIGVYAIFLGFLACIFTLAFLNSGLFFDETNGFPIIQNTSIFAPSANWLSNGLFYGLVLITACANHLYLTAPSTPVRVLRKRLGGPLSTFTVGEFLVLLFFILFQAGWFALFWFSTSYAASPLRQVARTLGHFNDLTISLLVLPVARNSVWTTIYGIPFERAIRYHRYLGRLTFTYITLHMLFWWISWLHQFGVEAWAQCVFQYNCTTVGNIRFDALTGHIAWLICLIMLITALNPIRRKAFEVFYSFHQLHIVFFIIAIIHSWDVFHFFVLGGLLLAFDRCARFFRSRVIKTNTVEVKAIAPNVTLATWQQEGFSHIAGQYCFVNIPEISRLQWHPFSISSPPHDSHHTFHIRACGDFTNELYKRAKEGGKITINVDGPYGVPSINFGCSPFVAFVVGGIGATPAMSMLGDLVRAFKEGGENFTMKKILFVWVVRTVEDIRMFESTLSKTEDMQSQGLLEQLIYVTKPSSGASLASLTEPGSGPETEALENSALVPNKEGRPDMIGILDKFGDDCKACTTDGKLTLVPVFACGPAPLVNSVRKGSSSLSNGDIAFECHEEVFLL